MKTSIKIEENNQDKTENMIKDGLNKFKADYSNFATTYPSLKINTNLDDNTWKILYECVTWIIANKVFSYDLCNTFINT